MEINPAQNLRDIGQSIAEITSQVAALDERGPQIAASRDQAAGIAEQEEAAAAERSWWSPARYTHRREARAGRAAAQAQEQELADIAQQRADLLQRREELEQVKADAIDHSEGHERGNEQDTGERDDPQSRFDRGEEPCEGEERLWMAFQLENEQAHQEERDERILAEAELFFDREDEPRYAPTEAEQEEARARMARLDDLDPRSHATAAYLEEDAIVALERQGENGRRVYDADGRIRADLIEEYTDAGIAEHVQYLEARTERWARGGEPRPGEERIWQEMDQRLADGDTVMATAVEAAAPTRADLQDPTITDTAERAPHAAEERAAEVGGTDVAELPEAPAAQQEPALPPPAPVQAPEPAPPAAEPKAPEL